MSQVLDSIAIVSSGPTFFSNSGLYWELVEEGNYRPYAIKKEYQRAHATANAMQTSNASSDMPTLCEESGLASTSRAVREMAFDSVRTPREYPSASLLRGSDDVTYIVNASENPANEFSNREEQFSVYRLDVLFPRLLAQQVAGFTTSPARTQDNYGYREGHVPNGNITATLCIHVNHGQPQENGKNKDETASVIRKGGEADPLFRLINAYLETVGIKDI